MKQTNKKGGDTSHSLTQVCIDFRGGRKKGVIETRLKQTSNDRAMAAKKRVRKKGKRWSLPRDQNRNTII